ncbi:hypothetical protein MVEN_01978300 [Mycena venus]|uniref:Novel STAND NTPase 1 domain-containing protein n=1 Tax=Mycena venus TaxID=2733690 RepID=A0A8H6XEC5_9AGAR|nr:hypothetical protein MVEN_01978300 [Mycena venus]
MPHQQTVTEIRVDNIFTGLRLATTLLNELHDAFGTCSLVSISKITVSLITRLQNVKKNKRECIQLMEDIHQVLFAIINLHIESDTPGHVPPVMFGHIGKFTEIMYKIHTFLEAQQDGNRIRNFFRQGELNTLLKDCWDGLRDAKTIQSGPNLLMDVGTMQKTAAKMHIELLEIISSLSDGTTSDTASCMHPTLNGFQMSSKSFSMLPSKPKIFHGRELELNSIVKLLHEDSARIAILGAGGMGKTSLARAALHHTDMATQYKHILFIPCDSATTSVGIAALMGEHIGLKPGKDLTRPVLHYFTAHPSCLLILDNLETAWEPLESRRGVEELLSLLTDIPHLTLMITMRGAERPAKVSWSQPFLPPLQPLSDNAARQMFFDIADDFHETKDLDQVLHLTQNMPLAIDLIAHLVDHEGCASVLARWKTEKTSLLSVGHDRMSNLDASIGISLSSPRVTASPGPLDLLRLLSILPDGLSNIELLQSSLPIPDVLACKTVLLGTCLAYQDDKKRLKSLVPIREHIQKFHPPASCLIQPLQNYFHMLLDLYEKYHGSQKMANTIDQIHSNFGNLYQILLHGLRANNPDATDTILCVLSLSVFSRQTGRGRLSLLDYIPAALPQPSDHKLEAQFTIELLFNQKIDNPDQLVVQARFHLCYLDDPLLECASDSLTLILWSDK